ncbi:MAG: aldo/keto reductase [Legionella sp.]|nr:aldo/keto reductase [Legionella sp.]
MKNVAEKKKVHQVELALGTVQFGMDYGVVGRGEVFPIKEVRQILERAFELGIDLIDTAPAYGQIETKLAALLDGYKFKVVSKIPAIPGGMDWKAAANFVSKSILQTRERLGGCLTTLLFHCSDDLLGDRGEAIWQAATKAVSGKNIRLGVSCYSPDELFELRHRFSIEIAQLPGNALDQRLRTCTDDLDEVEIHLRSIFLQGTLLNDPEKAAGKLPRQLVDALYIWQAWCKNQDISIMQGALSLAKRLPGVRYCVVGVDNLAQLETIHEAWLNTKTLAAYPPSTNNLEVIDPRYWFNQHVKSDSEGVVFSGQDQG